MTDAGAAVDAAKFVTMAHQVGGHATEKTSLRAFGGQILKPFQSKRRGEHEHEFYQRVFDSEAIANAALHEQLRPLLPSYSGVLVVDEKETGSDDPSQLHPSKYLVLGDLTWGRSWPCIMDVKVGTRSFEDGASAEKIEYERSKFPLQTSVGFRVQGIKVYDKGRGSYVEYDKHVGRGITSADELVGLFAKFFPSDNHVKAKQLLQAFIARLKLFEAWFEVQTAYEFIASSLLFLYDGDGPEDGNPDIRLIDFAHVQQPSPPRRDDGVLLGVKTLISIFEQLGRDVNLG